MMEMHWTKKVITSKTAKNQKLAWTSFKSFSRGKTNKKRQQDLYKSIHYVHHF